VLAKRLKTLPDKISHDVMVPLGKLAYVPGRLKHTNEILVLLGENWFAECSAKQSGEIIKRRVAKCEETIKQLEAEIKLNENWEKSAKQYYEDMTNHTKLMFHEKEEDDEAWREQHREKVREHRKKLQNGIISEEPQATPDDEADLWRRLDELELQEELQHELDLLGSGEEDQEDQEDQEEDQGENEDEEDEETNQEESEWNDISDDNINESENGRKSKKGVTWSETDSVRQFRINEILSETEVADANADAVKIHFKHTPSKISSSSSSSAQSTAAEETVSSPSDIFRKFCRTPETEAGEPKSILKVKKSTTPVIETAQDDDPVPPARQQRIQITAVGDEVKEHVLTDSQQEVTSAEATSAEVNTHRPVSRFKAARLNRKL